MNAAEANFCFAASIFLQPTGGLARRGGLRGHRGVRVVDVVPDVHGIIQVLERFFASAKVVIDPADVGERVGFARALADRLPQGQSLVEVRQGFVFLPQIGVNPAHGVEGHCLTQQTVRFLLDGKRLVEAVERLLQLAGLAVERGEELRLMSSSRLL